jgi:hypothetical protein
VVIVKLSHSLAHMLIRGVRRGRVDGAANARAGKVRGTLGLVALALELNDAPCLLEAALALGILALNTDLGKTAGLSLFLLTEGGETMRTSWRRELGKG